MNSGIVKDLCVLQDVLRYCCFGAMLQLGSFMLYASRASRHPHTARITFKHIADFLISSVSPGIPTVLIFSLFRCVVKLGQHKIEVLQTARIKTAAAVDTVVFDKTGTLTGSLVCSRPGLCMDCLDCEM